MEHPTWPCPTCGQDTQFEQPACPDGHTDDGGECPEWACVECGTAFMSGGVVPTVAGGSAWRRAA
ncbi:hypothetical protein [Modestobacter lapidis]|nr:hypothetical protein [Modestobacter lapidis]